MLSITSWNSLFSANDLICFILLYLLLKVPGTFIRDAILGIDEQN